MLPGNSVGAEVFTGERNAVLFTLPTSTARCRQMTESQWPQPGRVRLAAMPSTPGVTEGLGLDSSAAAHMWRTLIWPNNFL
jgi:hypothetical protein